MPNNRLVIPSVLSLAAAVISFSGIYTAYAVSETVTSRSVQMSRIRVSSTEVAAAANTNDPNNTCGGLAKRVVLYTVPTAGQIDSIVTKTNVAFSGNGVSQIGVRAVRAEQSGVQISSGDIATPNPDLMDTTYIENHRPNSDEIAFYDENATWDVVAYICGQDASSQPTNISSLSAGSVDFYIMVTKN
ncbi:hypothetical protein K8R04_01120 [Candidatus Uhrbacteria bacterium]|nr:hypothetical protein [Candidatus Uhrbacteria bacterium]